MHINNNGIWYGAGGIRCYTGIGTVLHRLCEYTGIYQGCGSIFAWICIYFCRIPDTYKKTGLSGQISCPC